MIEKGAAYLSSEIMGEVFITIDCVGIDGLINSLKETQKFSIILNNTEVEFILQCVSNVCGVRRDLILNGTERTDDRKIALCLAMYFMKEYTSIKSFEDLKKIFKKNVSLIHRNIKLVNNMPTKPKTDFDKKMDSHYKTIEKLIKEKKVKNGN